MPTSDPTKDAERLAEVGAGAIRTMLGMIGEADATDGEVARILVGNETAIHAFLKDRDRLTQERDEARSSAERATQPNADDEYRLPDEATMAEADARFARSMSVDAGLPDLEATQPSADDVERAREILLSVDQEFVYRQIAAALTAARREGADTANARYMQDHLDLVKAMYQERAAKVAEAREQGRHEGEAKERDLRVELVRDELRALRTERDNALAIAREEVRREGAELRALDDAVVEAARELVAHPWPLTGKIVPLRDALAVRDAAIRVRTGEE